MTDLIVIPMPLNDGGITYTIANLIEVDEGKVFAETITDQPRRISLSRYSVAKLRSGATNRPDLYIYDGMIMPAP